MNTDPLIIAKKELSSRLILGTGKFESFDLLKKSIQASETNLVTVAIRRVDLNNQNDDFLTHINPKETLLMPNTSGARNAEEAIRIAKLAKASGLSNWIKLEVCPEPNHLMPDPIETLKAATQLVKEGFTVLPYIHADPILAKHCEDVGCATVMPLASPIGTNQGLRMKDMIQLIIEKSNIPVIIDAGLGTPSHACEAMQMGADAVMVNTAIAIAPDPVSASKAFNWAVKAGRLIHLTGIAPQTNTAQTSSPLTGFLDHVL